MSGGELWKGENGIRSSIALQRFTTELISSRKFTVGIKDIQQVNGKTNKRWTEPGMVCGTPERPSKSLLILLFGVREGNHGP